MLWDRAHFGIQWIKQAAGVQLETEKTFRTIFLSYKECYPSYYGRFLIPNAQKPPRSLCLPLNIFTTARQAKRSSNWTQHLPLKGFPPTDKCTIMTTWAQSHIFSNWNASIVGLCNIELSFIRVQREKGRFWRKKLKSEASSETQHRKHDQTIFTCLILFVWEELKLLSPTYLSQEELFSQIFSVWVICHNM